MQKSNKKGFFTFFSVISILLALIFGACAVFCTLNYYEPDIAFFMRDAAVPQYMLYAAAGICVVYLVFGFIMNIGKSEERYDRPRLTGVTIYSGLLAGFSLIAADVLFLLDMYRSKTVIRFETTSEIVTAVMLILAVPAALYFFSISFGANERSTGAVVLGMFVVLWAAAVLLRLYFHMNLSLNSPTRILGQMVPIAIMCYFVQELRYRLGQARPALFHSFSAVAVLLIAVSAAIEITAAVKYGTTDTDRAFKLAELCIGIYILLSTFHLPSAVTGDRFEGRRALKERRLMREEDDDSYLDGLAENNTELDGVRAPYAEEYETAHDVAYGISDDPMPTDTAESDIYGEILDAGPEVCEDEISMTVVPDESEEILTAQAEEKTEQAATEAEHEAEPESETVPATAASETQKEAEPVPTDDIRRADVKKGLSVGAARRAESFISRMLEEDAQLEAEEDEFDTSCSMEESEDEAETE